LQLYSGMRVIHAVCSDGCLWFSINRPLGRNQRRSGSAPVYLQVTPRYPDWLFFCRR
jgi:hypothetical protein